MLRNAQAVRWPAVQLEPKWLRTTETQGPCPGLRGFCISTSTVGSINRPWPNGFLYHRPYCRLGEARRGPYNGVGYCLRFRNTTKTNLNPCRPQANNLTNRKPRSFRHPRLPPCRPERYAPPPVRPGAGGGPEIDGKMNLRLIRGPRPDRGRCILFGPAVREPGEFVTNPDRIPTCCGGPSLLPSSPVGIPPKTLNSREH